MTTRKCLACGQYFKPCPQTREQRYCSKIECQRERRRRTKEKQRQSNSGGGFLQPRPAPDTGNTYPTQSFDYSDQPESINYGQLPPGRYLITWLDADGITNGHAWLAEIRILSAFPDDG